MKYRYAVIIVSLALAGCAVPSSRPSVSAKEAVILSRDVRTFMAAVSDGVSTRGPIAWRDYFATGPGFFMAAEGRLAFSSGDNAIEGIDKVVKAVSSISLRWGAEPRVDPLTPTIAAVATSYHERLVLAEGRVVEEDGYFTGVAEKGLAGWKFRNCHWSVTTSPVVVTQ